MIKGYAETREVFINGGLLSPKRSLEVFNHSPDGFNWGYGGSGPAQLALALLLEYLDERQAVRLHQDFKMQVIMPIPQGEDFEIDESVVRLWVAGEIRKLEPENL